MASAILDNMYNYYLTTYGKSTVSRYDSHKKSELRSVYNNIIKINKESPLYKIKDSADAQKFAIDIKEHARDLKNVIASLSTGDSLAEAFQKKLPSLTRMISLMQIMLETEIPARIPAAFRWKSRSLLLRS